MGSQGIAVSRSTTSIPASASRRGAYPSCSSPARRWGRTAGSRSLCPSAWLARPVALRSADAQVARRYENPTDFEREATSAWEPFEGATGAFHDEAEARVSLVSTATIGTWDRRRFRSNVVLDGDGEDGLVGSRVGLGDALLDVRIRIPRCVMTTRPQPDGIERDLDVLRTIAGERDACLAVGALVASPGVVRVGDELSTP